MGLLLVPMVFFRPENFLSEAVIAYLEVPKIALLRTLVGLMVILWLVEWGVSSRSPFSWSKEQDGWLRPSAWLTRLSAWLRGQPTRWLILAVWFFLGTTLLSTVLSASFSVSLWGEVPGQDGFAAYTVIAYILLFGVITTHLKTRHQLWRLLGTIVVMGVVVAGYAVLQHYGYDFLGVLESTGGGRLRVTSTMGNAVFAAATMLMPISVSATLATVSLVRLVSPDSAQGKSASLIVILTVLVLWALVLTVQFLGITFTFSRGPWLGTILTLLSFLLLVAIFVRRQALGWATLVMGIAAVFTGLVLQRSGAFGGFNPGLWLVLGVILALVSGVMLGGSYSSLRAPLSRISQFSQFTPQIAGAWGQIALFVGVAGVLALVAVVGFSLLGDQPDGGPSSTTPVDPTEFHSLDADARFASISNEVLSGDISNRSSIWRGSLQLMQGHPWFEFSDLSLRWLRPLIGYGPDLFRYTYLLVSIHNGGTMLPPEPDHAHNFFLHQGVEQGILGLVSAVGIFAALFGGASFQLVHDRRSLSTAHLLVLIGLLSAMAGRFLEQTVGLARVSDLTVFWALLAAFVVLPRVFQSSEEEETTAPGTPAQSGRHRSRNRVTSRHRRESKAYDWQQLGKLVIVAWAIGGIIAITWVKSVNYPRAALLAGQGIERFQEGDPEAALSALDRATQLAPDVPTYYTFKSKVYEAYLQDPRLPPEAECNLQLGNTPYQVCLVEKIYVNNLEAVQQRPFYWRTRLALANSALALGRHEEAIRLYQEVASSVPNSWPLLNRLAEAYIDIGQPEQALAVLEESLDITRDTRNSEQALSLQTLAYQEMDDSEQTNPVP